MPLLVSIIIPCYNQEAYLEQAIESALGQTWPNLELIVIDDGSTDQSVQVAQRYAPRVVVHSQPNSGPSAARNRGLKMAEGEFVLFLDADDYLAPDMIGRLVMATEKHTDAAIVNGDCQYVDRNGRPLEFVPSRRFPENQFLALLAGNTMASPTRLVRRAALVEAGGFDESLRTFEDWDAWLRIVLHGGKIVSQPGAVSYYRRYPGTGSRNYELMKAGGFRVLEKIKGLVACRSLRFRITLCRSRFNIRQNTFKGILLPNVAIAARAGQAGKALSLLFQAFWKDWHLFYVAPVAVGLLAYEGIRKRKTATP